MRTFARWLLASTFACATGCATAAGTTDYTDQWFVPGEPGWGAAVLQQGNTLFVDLMIYGTDGTPTWYTAAAALQYGAGGRDAFAGDLWATTGPSFGGRFDPGQVSARKVGTLRFETDGATSATLAYTVDGVPATKAVTRQTWAGDNLTGHYVGAWRYEFQQSTDWVMFDVNHGADNRITLYMENAPPPSMGYLLMNGTYRADGRMGTVTAQLQAGDVGTIVLSEIEASGAGFTARVYGDVNGWRVDGRLALARAR